MAPQDDLTAERAATDMYNRLFSVMRLPEHEQHAKARLKLFYHVTRQEALREARQTISKLFDENTSGTPEYYCALLDAGNALDRLASEGASAPIDLLPKLKDDGGYGEHF